MYIYVHLYVYPYIYMYISLSLSPCVCPTSRLRNDGFPEVLSWLILAGDWPGFSCLANAAAAECSDAPAHCPHSWHSGQECQHLMDHP